MAWSGFKTLRLLPQELTPLGNELKDLEQAYKDLNTRVGRLLGSEPVSTTTTIGVTESRLLVAGAGLTGGGDLSADRQFDVGAGTGITVTADAVAVDNTVVPFGTGAAGRIAIWTGANTLSSDGAALWDNTNKKAGFGITPSASTARVAITPNSATIVGLQIRGAASQSAELFRCEDSSGSLVADILANGNIRFNTSGVAESSVPNDAKVVAVGLLVNAVTYPIGQFTAYDSAPYNAADHGGAITFGGFYENTKTFLTSWAAIRGSKTDIVHNNYGGFMAFHVRTNGSANIDERMRIIETGELGIGLVAPTSKLHVRGTTSPQLRIDYDASNAMTLGISSAGASTFTMSGASASSTFSGGNVGIGVTPTSLLHLRSTTSPQLRVEYDSTNKVSLAVDSTGLATLAITGTNPSALGPVWKISDTNNRGTEQGFMQWTVNDGSEKSILYSNNLGEYTFGYNLSNTQSGTLLGFILGNSSHPSWATRVTTTGIFSYIRHDEATIAPSNTNITGVRGWAEYFAGSTYPTGILGAALTQPVNGVVSGVACSSDTASFAGKHLVSLRILNTGKPVNADYQNIVENRQTNNSSPWGNWDMAVWGWAEHTAYRNTGDVCGDSGPPSNKPLITASWYIPIQACATNLQYGIYGDAPALSRAAQNACTDSAFMLIPFPTNSSATNTSHLDYVAKAAGAGGPAWTRNGGYYFDDGTTNSLGTYHSNGTNWYYHLSQKNAAASAVPAQVAGAARTLDTVGAAGPANAALQGWVQVEVAIDGAGTRKVNVWVPYWT